MKQVTLQKGTVLLRPWQIEDARWYVETRDEEVYRWTTERRALTIGETEEAIEQVNTSENVFSSAIVDAECNQLVGNLALVLEEKNQTSGEVMYWLSPAGRGRGIASQAVELLCRWAFDELGLTRVTLQTHVENLRSQRVAERVGFQRMASSEQVGEQPHQIWFVWHKQP
jgi:RimJ/RimL family protein N-acetyltransferase